MRRRHVLAALGCAAAAGTAKAQSAAPASTPAARVGEIVSLGNDRFQVGRIVIDKRGRSFAVAGRVYALGKPLEYLATTPTGRKAYESLLTLDTTGSEFNLACILIGLERDPNVPSSRPLTQPGQSVFLSVAWTDAQGQRRQLTAVEALLGAEAAAKITGVAWAYTGSFTSIDGSQLAADHTGTLIGFVPKDRTGLIEAARDMDWGPYGAIRGHAGLPPEGSPIELIVDAAVPKK